MKIKMLITFVLTALIFSSCLKDKNYKTYTIYRPEYSVKQEVKQDAKLQSPQTLKDLGNFVLYNNAMYITEKNKGIHVVDYSNPANPLNKGFVPIPGNTGISIKNNVLYADCYSELFVFSIGTDQSIQLKNVLENTFTSRMGTQNYDTNYVKLTWIKKDTTVKADNNAALYNNCITCDGPTFYTAIPANNNPSGNSVGSSMAVFTIINDHLYTVDNSNLFSFSINDLLNPVKESSQYVSWDVETIFPFKDKLFIGSMTGMYVYNIENPSKPSYISQFNHVRVCDPVIADDKFAFVTLRNGTTSGGFTNELDILNIETITDPVLVKTFPFSSPHGLGKDANVLFVCDGMAGLKVIDASDVNNLQIKQSLTIGNALDVVAYNHKAFVMLEDAIKIYAYDQQFNVSLLGSINKN